MKVLKNTNLHKPYRFMMTFIYLTFTRTPTSHFYFIMKKVAFIFVILEVKLIKQKGT